MVGTTALFDDSKRTRTIILAVAVLVVVIAVGVIAVNAMSPGKKTTSDSPGSATTTGPVGANMAGAQQDVYVSQAAIDAKPAPMDLSTPERAITSYLAWTSYAYRIVSSAVATPAMGADQGVRVDSYIQYNLQQSRLLDQHLDSITFGTASRTATATLVPAKEKWTYSYLSIAKGGKTLGGPYSAAYETTYTLSKTPAGWVVVSIAVTPIGTIK